MWCGDEEALKKTAAARWKRAAGRVYAHMLSSCVSCLVSPVDDRHDDPRFRPRPIFARGYEPVSHFWYPRRWRRAQGASDELLHVRPSPRLSTTTSSWLASSLPFHDTDHTA